MRYVKLDRLVVVGFAVAGLLFAFACSGDDDSSDDPGSGSPIDRADPTTSSNGDEAEGSGTATGELPGDSDTGSANAAGGESAAAGGGGEGGAGEDGAGDNSGGAGEQSGGGESGGGESGGGESGGGDDPPGDDGAGQPSAYQVTFCTGDEGCGADETCLMPRWSDTTGICTPRCGGTGSNDPCQSAERAAHGLSQMCIAGSVTRIQPDGSQQTTSYQACGYLCRDEFGQTYNCPADTTCWDLNPNQAICVPPQ